MRSIINLDPSSTDQTIQRRLCTDFQRRGDSSSLAKLQVYALIYGVKDEYTDLDRTIYDYEKAYEVTSDERFIMHMPIDMNGFNILKTSHYLIISTVILTQIHQVKRLL